MNFEDGLKELEQIVGKLENGTTLEEGVKLFERGSEVVKACYGALNSAKGKIQVVREFLDKVQLEDMN